MDAKWTDTCRAARKRQGLVFCAVLVLFGLVAVLRAGLGGQGAAVHSALQASLLSGRFSHAPRELRLPDGDPCSRNDGSDACCGGGGSGSASAVSTPPISSQLFQGLPFAEAASAADALEYFALVVGDLSAAAAESAHEALGGHGNAFASARLGVRAVGFVVGAPVLKQWRAATDAGATAERPNCAAFWKLLAPPRCDRGFDDAPRRDAPLAQLPLASALAAAYEWRAWAGDVPWKVGDQEYPAGAYALELPLQSSSSAVEKESSGGAAALVRALAAYGWADGATRGLSLEVAFYSPARDRLSAVQLLVELPDGVGVLPVRRVRVHQVHTWNFRPTPAGSPDQVSTCCFGLHLHNEV